MHGVEGAAEPAELVASPQCAASVKVARRQLLGSVDQTRGAAGQQEVKREPHRQRKRGRRGRPVERLVKNLRASFRFGPVEIVGEEQATRSRGAQFLPLTAHQDARVTQQRVLA